MQLYVCVCERNNFQFLFDFYLYTQKIKKTWGEKTGKIEKNPRPLSESWQRVRNENVLASSNNGKSQPAAIQVLTWSCSPISELESAGSVCQLASRCTCRAAADVQFAVICRSAWGRKLLRLLLPVSQLLSRPVSQPASQAVSQLSPASI